MRYPKRHHQPDELDYNFERYLLAKQAIDDAALNRSVLDELIAHLPYTSRATPLQVLELGSGIGTMVERMMGWELLKFADYTAVDADEELTRRAHNRLKLWSLDCGFKTNENSPRMLDIQSMEGRVSITFECADAYQYLERHYDKRQWDLGMAHAFMDLVDPVEMIYY